MVFGNMGDDSGTGVGNIYMLQTAVDDSHNVTTIITTQVAFTRSPTTGEAKFYGTVFFFRSRQEGERIKSSKMSATDEATRVWEIRGVLDERARGGRCGRYPHAPPHLGDEENVAEDLRRTRLEFQQDGDPFQGDAGR